LYNFQQYKPVSEVWNSFTGGALQLSCHLVSTQAPFSVHTVLHFCLKL